MNEIKIILLKHRRSGRFLAKVQPFIVNEKIYEIIDAHTFKVLTPKETEEAQKIYNENQRLKKDNESLLKQLKNR